MFKEAEIRTFIEGTTAYFETSARQSATVGSPYLVDGVHPAVRSGPPTLGRDTDAVLAGLGLGAAEIDDLRTRGVVA